VSGPSPAEVAEGAARARRFLRDCGAVRLGLAAEVALGTREAGALADALAAAQDARGAIAAEEAPGEAAPAGPIAATAEALALLDLVDSLDQPVVERAAAFLGAAQAPDGSFADPDEGGEPARLSRTAAVLALLARTPFARASTLAAGEAWLRARWRVELVQGPAYLPILAYFQVLANLPSEIADEALQWCGRELERGFRTGVFSAGDVARVFLRCGARALPGARIHAHEVVEALLAAQAEDGSFEGARAADAWRAAFTLEGLVALLRLSG
jgi:hypothetical protein